MYEKHPKPEIASVASVESGTIRDECLTYPHQSGPSTQQENAPSTSRNDAIEGLRIIAAFLIVWYHAEVAGHDIAYSGLVIFVILTFYFAFGQNIGRRLTISYLARRLLVPWASWALFYAAANLVRHRPPINIDGGVISGLLAGPNIHLWYLPFAFASLLLLGSLRQLLPTRALALSAAAVAIGLLLTVPIWRSATVALGYPWAQYAHALVPVSFGMLFGLSRFGVVERFSLIAVLIVLVASPAFDDKSVGMPYLIGAVAVLSAFAVGHALPFNLPEFGKWSGAMLGVYLIHPAVLNLLRSIVNWNGPTGVVLVFALSAGAVLVFRQFAPRAAAIIVGFERKPGSKSVRQT